MSYGMKKLVLTCAFVLVNCIIAVVISKLLNTSIESTAAWMALGACCGMQADSILDR